jgi:transposase
VRTKGTYLSAYYRQVMRRQGKQKAVMALTHKILVIAWNLLSTGALYDDPGPAAVTRVSEEQQRRRAIRQLEALGLTVTVRAPYRSRRGLTAQAAGFSEQGRGLAP